MILAAAVFAASFAAAQAAKPADLILRKGRIFLGGGQYAESLAVAGNRIAKVGTDAEVLALKGPKTRVIELNGRAVTPGFHDAHAHFFKGAVFLTQVDLYNVKSIEEVRDRVADYAARHPRADWIVGRGWDATSLKDGRLPQREDLDAAVSSRPVALTDADGHRLWLNSLALERAGITSRTPKLNNGEIYKDERGRPTGLFAEDAMSMAARAVPQPSRDEKLAALRLALITARENGVTAVDSMQGPVDYSPEEQYDLWRELVKSGEATTRLFIYGKLDDVSGAAKLQTKAREFPRNRLAVVGVKGFVDGVLGARTAALLAPYFDDSHTRGEPRYAAFRLDSLVRSAHKAGLQVALHAVGDRAVRMALDACEKSEKKSDAEDHVLPEFPCRVEHAEVVSPADAPRFKALSIAASMQPSHLVYADQTGNYNPNRLGERVRNSFPWKTLEDAGAALEFGTDWPVAPLSPRLALFAATTRENLDGKPDGGWIPEEKISLESALQHYTLDPARVLGLDEELGSIRPGKLADLVVFSDDLFARAGRDLLRADVDATVFDGKVVYERAASSPTKK